MKSGIGDNLMVNTAFEGDQGSGSQSLRIFKVVAGSKNSGPRKTKNSYRFIRLMPRQNRSILQPHLNQLTESTVEQLVDFLVFVGLSITAQVKFFYEFDEITPQY